MVKRLTVVALATVVATGAGTAAAVDFGPLTLVVDTFKATNNSAIAAYGYDPVNDVVFSCGFTAGAQIRKVTNVSNPALQVSTQYVSTNDWLMFLKDGDPNRGSGTPTIGSLRLNPKPIYDADGVTVLFPAYTQCFITDQVTAVLEGGVPRWDLTQRTYRYNCQQVQLPPDPVPPPPPYYDGRDVFTSLVTVQEQMDVLGLAPSGTTTGGSNNQHQVAFSSNGQYIYYIDGNRYGGIWKCRARDGGELARIYATDQTFLCHPDVMATSVRDFGSGYSGDQVIVRGNSTSGNTGGVDYVVDTGSAAYGAFPLLTMAQLQAFLEITSATVANAVLTDADGNVYIDEGTSKAVLRYDPQGRLVKMKSQLEHAGFNAANIPGTNYTCQQLQGRIVKDPATGTFDVFQILFRSVTQKGVAGIYCYKPGDFNRDNAVTGEDVKIFNQMMAKGPTTPPLSDPDYQTYLRCDLNGNGSMTAKDRSILNTFIIDSDGDNDVDGADYGQFAGCFNGSGNVVPDACLLFDYNGDQFVDGVDYGLFASCFNGSGNPSPCFAG